MALCCMPVYELPKNLLKVFKNSFQSLSSKRAGEKNLYPLKIFLKPKFLDKNNLEKKILKKRFQENI